MFLYKLDIKGKQIKAYQITGSPIAKLTGRALLRIPVISVIALSALELPAIIKAFTREKSLKNNVISGSKQTAKSSINVVSILSGIGLAGAYFAKAGPIGSLLGMGIGSVAGSYVSRIFGNLFKH